MSLQNVAPQETVRERDLFRERTTARAFSGKKGAQQGPRLRDRRAAALFRLHEGGRGSGAEAVWALSASLAGALSLTMAKPSAFTRDSTSPMPSRCSSPSTVE